MLKLVLYTTSHNNKNVNVIMFNNSKYKITAQKCQIGGVMERGQKGNQITAKLSPTVFHSRKKEEPLM